MSKHTPGPWVPIASLNRWNVTTCTKPRTFNICYINTDRIEQEANAKLIAAAPDLLAALEAIVKITDGSQPKDYPGALMVARSAIAKATS